VDEQDRVIGTRSFATARQGYRQMLAWMGAFGDLQRIGVESTGSYGAGLLRFMQQAGIAVLEVTTPDKQDRRRRGKNDDLDAQNAAKGLDLHRLYRAMAWLGDGLEEKPAEARLTRWTGARSWRSCSSAATT
jgi:transposase